MPISSYKEDKPNIIAFVNLVIGVIIGIAVTAFLIVPTIKKNQPSDNNTNYDSGISVEQLQEKETEITALQNEKDQLEQEKEQLQTQIDSIVIPEDKSAVYAPLIDAAGLYLTELSKTEADRNFTPIADELAAVNDASMEIEASAALLGQLRTATYLSAAKVHYQSGHALYSDGKYTEAFAELKKAMTFDPTDVNAIYFTARAYQRMGDKQNAALYYNIVITEHPDSTRISDAKKYLAQVQE
jgi:TolA-binding protein